MDQGRKLSMNQKKRYSVPGFAKKTYLNTPQYHQLYQRSIEEPESFWGEQANKFITWFSSWETVTEGDSSAWNIQWFTQGKLNACYNCVDRHLANRKNQAAIIWEGNEPGQCKQLSYGQLYEHVCKFSHVLQHQGIKKGDRVCIYLPMIPEAMIAMLACARIGAVHSVVFAGFSAESLKTRILDAECSLLITADEGLRGDKTVPLKHNSVEALKGCSNVRRVIVVKHTGNEIPWDEDKDRWYHEVMAEASTECPIAHMDSSDPLFILYTSGSTGKPKGIIHATGGYMVYAATTHHYVFDHHPDDIFWCTADIGWITGHTYLVYGPLANGGTIVLYEGVPNYPDFSRYWEIIHKYQVTIFYTAPTAIRMLRREGDDWVNKVNRQSLNLLGSVGEPINPDVWEWFYEVVGEQRCPIVDTWWQTETGGIMISPLPGATPLVPGAVSWPFFGIVPEIVDDQGQTVQDGTPGKLVIKKPWPGLMHSIYGDPHRFYDTYFKEIPGYYCTGDSGYRDKEGYFWVTGRNDDVIKISGHRVGTGEVESALLGHPGVSEAAVVGIPDEIKGEAVYAFISLKAHLHPTECLKHALIEHLRNAIGPIVKLEVIQWARELPKTRSGKIMRRILRKIARGEFDNLGDLSTLSDSTVVTELIQQRQMISLSEAARKGKS